MNSTTTDASIIAQELLNLILDEITFHHDKRKLSVQRVGRSATIHFQLNKADTTVAVGKGGEHIQALQQIIMAIGAAKGQIVRLRLDEPVEGEYERHPKFVPMEFWNSEKPLILLGKLCEAIFRHPCKIDLHDEKNAMSVIEIVVDERENKMLVETMKKSFHVLYNIIGKINGRLLDLYIMTPKEHAEAHAQPVHA